MQKKDIANELIGGTSLPHNYRSPYSGFATNRTSVEIIKPLSGGKYYRRPHYVQSGEFRTFGELRRSAWDS